MTIVPATWRDIRDAAEAVGIDARSWEEGMHDRILESLLARTQSAEQYHTSADFYDQMNKLMAYILAAVFEHDPLSETLRPRAEDLGAAFRDEIQEAARRGGPR